MLMDIKELLREFMLTPAPSGYESEMAVLMKKRLGEYCDEISSDRIGNVIGKINGSDPKSPSIMLFGHMDQLGFIVRRTESDGYIQVDRLGGIPEKVLPGLEVQIRSEDGLWYPGVIGAKSHHATTASEKYKVDEISALFIDMGAKSDAELHDLGIFVGCPAVYKPAFLPLLGSRVAGTSVDNRGACACLVSIAQKLCESPPACDVYLVATVWEEFNLRGAMIAARTVKPQIAISLDVSLSADTRDLTARFEDVLGQGPCVHLYSFHGRGTLNGTIAHGPLFKLIKKTSSGLGIPLQRFAASGILTDAAYIQLEGEGVSCIEMGFPARYTHTPVEVCDTCDIEGLASLCAEVTRRIDSDFELKRF